MMCPAVSPLLLAFQSETSFNINFWLVIAGLVIIFCCLLIVFLPKHEKSPFQSAKDLLTNQQEIEVKPVGLSLKVSILTVFVLMGFILSLSSFALQWRGFIAEVKNYQAEIERDKKTHSEAVTRLTTQIEQLREGQERARKFNMAILVKLPGEADAYSLNLNEWTCRYWLVNTGKAEPTQVDDSPVVRRAGNDSLELSLKDITPETRIQRLELLKNGKPAYQVTNFSPFLEGTHEAESTGEDR